MPTGKKITLEAKSSDTIKMVKDQIEATEGIPSRKQILKSGGRRMENSRRLSFYNIQPKSILQLIKRGMKIFVKVMISRNVRTITLSVEPSDTIKMVKVKIQEKIGIVSELQRLTFDNRDLKDDCTLRHYNIQSRSALCVLLKPSL